MTGAGCFSGGMRSVLLYFLTRTSHRPRPRVLSIGDFGPVARPSNTGDGEEVTSEQTPHAAVGAGLLASPVRRAIVDALKKHHPAEGDIDPGGMTAAQLSEVLGLHPTTVRFHTDRLEAAGIIASHLTTAFGVGRPRKVYALPPHADDADRATYLLRLLELMTESFSTSDTPEQAGERWARDHLPRSASAPASSPGAWLGKIGPLVDLLRDWGYSPELTTSDGGRTCRIALADCPFMELARANTAVVCGIHQGLLRGALHQLGEDDVGVSISPFVGPNLCHADVTTRQSFADHHVHQSTEAPREESPHES